MTDWSGTLASWGANILLLGGGLIAYGQQRQKVIDLDKRAVEQTQRLDGLEAAVARIGDVSHAVDMLRESTVSAHTLMMTQVKGGQDLSAERFDGLRGEVRAFMQGMASAGAPSSSRAPRKSGADRG